MKKLIVPFAAAFVIIACNSNPSSKNIVDPIVTHIDSSISPADNFFLFANNAWFKANPIPSTKNSVGIFRTIQDTVNSQVRQICEKSAALTNAKKGSKEQMIGDYYFSGMDTVGIEKMDLVP